MQSCSTGYDDPVKLIIPEELIDKESIKKTASNVPYYIYPSGITVSNSQILDKSNIIKLSNNSNVEVILEDILNTPQKGTKLLNLSGVFKGPKDMSSDKKKYIEK